MFHDLNENNCILFAAKVYDRPGAVLSEFEEDMSRFNYLKRLLTKYYDTGVLKDQLITNHLVVLHNVFGHNMVRILFVKLDEKDLEVVKPFLMSLKYLPEVVLGVNGRDIVTSKIRNDEGALKCSLALNRTKP